MRAGAGYPINSLRLSVCIKMFIKLNSPTLVGLSRWSNQSRPGLTLVNHNLRLCFLMISKSNQPLRWDEISPTFHRAQHNAMWKSLIILHRIMMKPHCGTELRYIWNKLKQSCVNKNKLIGVFCCVFVYRSNNLTLWLIIVAFHPFLLVVRTSFDTFFRYNFSVCCVCVYLEANLLNSKVSLSTWCVQIPLSIKLEITICFDQLGESTRTKFKWSWVELMLHKLMIEDINSECAYGWWK